MNFGDAYDVEAAAKHGDLGPAVAGNFGGGAAAVAGVTRRSRPAIAAARPRRR